MNAEDTLNTRREQDDGSNPYHDKRKKEPQQAPREERGPQARESGDIHRTRPLVNLPPSKFQNYTPLNAPVEKVFVHIRDDRSIKWPERICAPPEKMSQDKYCCFHRDHGHKTNDCFNLKEPIEALIWRGRL